MHFDISYKLVSSMSIHHKCNKNTTIYIVVLGSWNCSAAAKIDPQNRFSANCKRVLRVDNMRDLLEML